MATLPSLVPGRLVSGAPRSGALVIYGFKPSNMPGLRSSGSLAVRGEQAEDTKPRAADKCFSVVLCFREFGILQGTAAPLILWFVGEH